jgi:uncharacterized protein RhaS with RHS repeats
MGESGFEVLHRGSVDPLGDGPNLYAYVKNDPTDRMDPFGLSPCTDKCWDDAKDRNHDVDTCAKYGGLAGLGAGGLAGGAIGAGKGMGIRGGIAGGVLGGAGNYAGIQLLGTAYNAARYGACLLKCALTEDRKPDPTIPPVRPPPWGLH